MVGKIVDVKVDSPSWPTKWNVCNIFFQHPSSLPKKESSVSIMVNVEIESAELETVDMESVEMESQKVWLVFRLQSISPVYSPGKSGYGPGAISVRCYYAEDAQGVVRPPEALEMRPVIERGNLVLIVENNNKLRYGPGVH